MNLWRVTGTADDLEFSLELQAQSIYSALANVEAVFYNVTKLEIHSARRV